MILFLESEQFMSTIITILVAVLVFGVVILVHEFGHYVTAKCSGVQVNEFSIGMGPALFKKIWHGTQYSIRLLPIGGYVAMEGEDSPESTNAPRPAVAENAGPQPPAAEADDEEEEEDLNPVPPELRTGRPFNEVAIWKRFVIMVAGAFMNFVLGFLVLLAIVGTSDSIVTLRIYGFEENALCSQTGLQAEDTIYAINGRRCYVAEDVSYELSRTENYSADFTVLRAGEKVQLDNVQFDTYVDENGEVHMPPQIIVYSARKTPLRVLQQSWNYERYYARIIVSTLVDLARGHESINNLSGPVGIVAAIGQAVSIDWETLFSLMALITINLGIFNLLPLPALDGGKVVFLIYEGLRGRPAPQKVQEFVNVAGFVLLFGLMIFATYNDIVRLITGQLL